jgi:hypothetical protein
MKIQKYKKVASTLSTNNRSVRMRDVLGNNGTSSFSASAVSIPTVPISNVLILGTSVNSGSSYPACFCVNDNTCPTTSSGFQPDPTGNPSWRSWGYNNNWDIKGLGNIGSGYLFVYRGYDARCNVEELRGQAPVIMFTLRNDGYDDLKISTINKLNVLIDQTLDPKYYMSLSHMINYKKIQLAGNNNDPYLIDPAIVNIVDQFFVKDEPLYNYNPISPIILNDNRINFSGLKNTPYNIKDSIINNVKFESDISFNISDIEFLIASITSGTDVAEIVKRSWWIPPTEIKFLTSGTCELQVYQRYFQNKSNLTGYGRKLFTIKINATVV